MRLFLRARLDLRLCRLVAAFVLIAGLPGIAPTPPAAAAGSGPGGVGETNGASSLKLWLKADAGVTSSSGSVSSWADQSGHSNTAGQAAAASQPSLLSDSINGLPAIQFDGIDDLLTGTASISFTTPAALLIVARDEGSSQPVSGLFSSGDGGVGVFSDGSAYVLDGDGADASNSASTSSAIDSYRIITALYASDSTTNTQVYLNGLLEEDFAGPGVPVLPAASFEVGGRTAGVLPERVFGGLIAELIVYTATLTAAERTHLELYLMDRYDIDLSGTGLYSSTTHTQNVRGISQSAGVLGSGSSAGLVITNTSFLVEDDDVVVFGHNTLTNSVVTTDLPAGVVNRWQRAWFVDVNDSAFTVGGAVQLAFDFGLAGLGGAPAGAAHYRLLERSGPTGAFTATATAVSVSGSQVIFSVGVGSGLADGRYYTLGYANAAPVLDTSGSPTLTTIAEDVASAANTGTLVSSLIASLGGSGITDADGDAAGVAVTSVDDTNGTWQYDPAGGTAWVDFGAPSSSAARLLAPAARVRFVPDLNYNGAATLSFRAWDQTSGTNGSTADTSTNGGTTAYSTAIETATLTITAVNDPPTISDIPNQTTPEETPVGPITFTVGDVESAATSLTLSAASSNVSLVPVSNISFGGSGITRTVSLTPTQNGTGTAVITVTVSDGSASSSDSFTLTVTNLNDPPTISNIPDQVTPEDVVVGPLSFTIGDVETAASSLTLSRASSNTTLVPVTNIVFGGSGAARTVTITPALNLSGSAAITITVSDGAAAASDSFSLTVTAVNDPPAISNIANHTTPEDTPTGPITFTVSDVESAATSLIVSAASSNTSLVPPGNMTLRGIGETRTVALTPMENLFGSSVITISVSDGAASGLRSFILTVTPVNDPPVFTSAPVTGATQAVPYTYAIAASDADGDALTITAPSRPVWLSFVDHGGGAATLSGTPPSSAAGSHAVTLQASDPHGASATQSFTLTVSDVNDPPVANDDTADTLEDTPRTILVLGNDTDLDAGDTLTVIAVGAPLSGTATSDGLSVVYTPTLNITGQDVFTYTISDGALTDSATITVTVGAINDPPLAVADLRTTDEDVALVIDALGNDTDPDGDTLTIVAAGPPANGTALINANKIVYQPADNFHGLEVFTYTISDGALASTASITVSVIAVNDPPIVLDNAATTLEDVPVTLNVLSNDSDADGQPLTVSAVGQPANGTATTDGATVTYTPALNFNGSDVFTYTASDGSGGSGTANVVITVTAVNDPPSISNLIDRIIIVSTSTGPIGLVVSDPETSADALTFELSSSDPSLVPPGSIQLSGSGTSRTLTVTPLAGQLGTAAITVTVRDGEGGVTAESFMLTVVEVIHLHLALIRR